MLPDVGRLRAGAGRLRGLRLIHTHLRNEPLSRDDLVDLTRLRLDMVVAICLAPGEERALCIYYGHNFPSLEETNEPPFRTFGPIPYAKASENPAEIIATIEQEYTRAARARGVAAKDGRAILVHVCDKRSAARAEDSLRELEELARTAGVEVVDRPTTEDGPAVGLQARALQECGDQPRPDRCRCARSRARARRTDPRVDVLSAHRRLRAAPARRGDGARQPQLRARLRRRAGLSC